MNYAILVNMSLIFLQMEELQVVLLKYQQADLLLIYTWLPVLYSELSFSLLQN